MYLHIINILYEKYEKQIEYTPPEPKDCWSFHHFKTGVSVSDRCGAMLPAQPESLYIVPPKAHFRIIGSEDGYVNTIIWFKADSKLMDKFDLPLFSPIELPDIEYISKLLMDMYEAHLSDMPIKEEVRNALLITVFASLYRFCHIDKLGAAQKTGRDLTFTRMSILSSPGIDWSASSMAAYANMSVAQFYKKYKELFGKTPMEDLYDQRFTNAKRLMKTGYDIKYILHSCGFKSMQHFSAFFKKRSGMSPSEYIRLHAPKKKQP